MNHNIDLEARNRLILALSKQIAKFLDDIRAKHKTTIDLDTDVLLFSTFQSVSTLLDSNLITKEQVEAYFMTVINTYLATAGLNLYIGRYDEVPKPKVDQLN